MNISSSQSMVLCGNAAFTRRIPQTSRKGQNSRNGPEGPSAGNGRPALTMVGRIKSAHGAGGKDKHMSEAKSTIEVIKEQMMKTGVPDEIYIDNGCGYVPISSKALQEGACHDA